MLVRHSISDKRAHLQACLERASFDAAVWTDVCDCIASLLDATGTLLIPQQIEDRAAGMPHSSNLGEVIERFIQTGWYERDFRSQGFKKAIATGFVTDHDLIDPSEMGRHPYYAELLAPVDLQWFVGAAFNVDGRVWGAAIHRSPRRGPFQSNEIETLLSVRDDIEFAARRAAALGHARIQSFDDLQRAANRAIVTLDCSGKITWMNAVAEDLLIAAGLCRAGRLGNSDGSVNEKLDAMVQAALARGSARQTTLSSRPVLVSGSGGRLFSVDVFPTPRDFGAVLAGASGIATIHEVAPEPESLHFHLNLRFGLTKREAEIGKLLLAGRDISEAAAEMSISIATARQYVKSAFAKTGTRRQAELVALLARVR